MFCIVFMVVVATHSVMARGLKREKKQSQLKTLNNCWAQLIAMEV
jgi:hypothetical protein